MATVLSGKEVTAALNASLSARSAALLADGIRPCLAIVRLGQEPGDIAYERGAMKRAEAVGVAVRQYVLPRTASQEELLAVIREINEDTSVHGALLLRPFPVQIDDRTVRNALRAEKDMDGITDASLAGVFTNTPCGYAPCTAEACMAVLDHYGIDPAGMRTTVIGRSLVIGKPIAMMLLRRNATVTICHTRTKDMAREIRRAELVIAAAGQPKMVTADMLKDGQILIDVGVNVDEEGNLCGDADYEAAGQLDLSITPVPGGVGTVTSSVLMRHVIEAAESLR
jgi:methylenetetrahydrofolate dehydrogenase (NADP+)/methenyltetrahydrofolate cyclohydrolase